MNGSEALPPGPPRMRITFSSQAHPAAGAARVSHPLGALATRHAHKSCPAFNLGEKRLQPGPGANQQKRGRVSRELRAQLEEEIADGNH